MSFWLTSIGVGLRSRVNCGRACDSTLHVGHPAANNRLFVEAVLFRYRAGIPWRDLPERFGDFRVIHLRHSRWSRSGVWQRAFEALAEDADNEWAMIDSTIVRAHQHSAGAKGGAAKRLGAAEGA